jgi:membrane protein YqaA with SNARE-associated domain
MLEFLSPSVDYVVNSNYSLVLLALVSTAESIFLPIPPDVFLIPLSLINPSFSFIFALIATIFSISGGVIGYYIGNKGGKPLVRKLISKEKLDKVRVFYNKYDIWAILIAAFSPIPYKVFTISAGLFDLNLRRFMLASLIGRGGRFFLIATLIFIFGPPIKKALSDYFELFTLLVVALLIGGILIANLLFKRK